MPIVSIVLFILTGALLIYAGITALTKEVLVGVTRSASVKNISKEYALKIAKTIALISAGPFVGAIFGLFIDIVAIPVIIAIVLLIGLLVLGIKVIMKK